jgi:hypothetical protein
MLMFFSTNWAAKERIQWPTCDDAWSPSSAAQTIRRVKIGAGGPALHRASTDAAGERSGDVRKEASIVITATKTPVFPNTPGLDLVMAGTYSRTLAARTFRQRVLAVRATAISGSEIAEDPARNADHCVISVSPPHIIQPLKACPRKAVGRSGSLPQPYATTHAAGGRPEATPF